MIAFFLALIPYLDDRAEAALTTLRPALEASDDEYSQLRHRLTTLPALPTLLASLAAVIFLNLITAFFGAPIIFDTLAATSPISAALLYFMYMAAWWVFGALMYHTIHQLGLINRIYTKHVRITLFEISPLYAFSSLTALTAVSVTLTTYAWLAINPESQSSVGFGVAMLITVLGLAAFVWPLLGIHRLLVQEKTRLLDEGSRRLEAAILELHRRMDSGELEGMMDLSMAIGGLETEQNVLKAIPTWPWEPEIVRLLITALLLPLGLWVIQAVLPVIMGP
jgi:hypothetical protein